VSANGGTKKTPPDEPGALVLWADHAGWGRRDGRYSRTPRPVVTTLFSLPMA
jgi:hypothetical protein